MLSEILPYLDALKHRVKQKASSLLSSQTAREVACNAFAFHFKDRVSLEFQCYYRDITDNREAFINNCTFFRAFKQKYSLQGIDGVYLDGLEKEKETMCCLIDKGDISSLYFRFFANASLQHGKDKVVKNLGSFFAKLVHTLRPGEFSVLDNPIKKYVGLENESFYVAFVTVSKGFREWIDENTEIMCQIRCELERNEEAKSFSKAMTNLKLLDLIFWHQANEVTRKAKKSKQSK